MTMNLKEIEKQLYTDKYLDKKVLYLCINY